jgi:Ran GTPase-activating protein (RanGAP) involved in mRNA processing and transport
MRLFETHLCANLTCESHIIMPFEYHEDMDVSTPDSFFFTRSYNCLRSAAGRALGEALSLNSTLETLSLAVNCLEDEGGHHVVQGLFFNRSLLMLDISDNQIREQPCHLLADALSANMCALRSLHMHRNSLGDCGCQKIAAALASNHTLQVYAYADGGLQNWFCRVTPTTKTSDNIFYFLCRA